MNYALTFAIALFSSLIFTPLVRWLSISLRIIDRPGFRKIHRKPIALMGGVAIFFAFILALAVFYGFSRELLGIFAIGLLIVMFGILDDINERIRAVFKIRIRARYKIWIHLVFAFIFIWITGVHLGLFRFAFMNWIITACFITFMANSMNMLDGMDGLVSGVGFIASLFFFLLSAMNNLPQAALLSIALAGATLGFLRYNFNPASIFLGEGGATFIGFILAVISLKLYIFNLWDIALVLSIPRIQVISFIIPVIILGIPVFDTSFVFINRFWNRIKMSTPGKDHSHHRIHLMGFSHKATVLVLYGIQIVLGSIALVISSSNIQQFFALLVILTVFVIFAWNFLLRVKVYSRSFVGK